ncbi:hypothetical protein C8J57DRAFT_1718778 [Mycena rebaudengoi]|nr:hypothetical protein C8J57DRAFT_1718778 [Mycena rebaudengoi]
MIIPLLAVRLISDKRGNSSALYGEISIGSCEDIHACRRLFNILWGCLATVFASTWISVHPNVPKPGHSWYRLTFRRLCMMLVAVIAPEVMVYFAARQWFVARKFSQDYGVSKTHGFFFSMGGFVSQAGNPITTTEQLHDPLFGAKYLSAIRETSVEDIMDKSKGDACSKGIAFLQGLWFILQCMARAAQRLLVSQIEVATLAFAVVNVFTWLLWWNKPIDVQRAIYIGPTLEELAAAEYERSSSTPPHTGELSVTALVVGPLSGDYDSFDPTSSTAVPAFWSSPDVKPNALWIEVGVGIVFGGINCGAWYAIFPTTGERLLWQYCSVLITVLPVIIVFAILADTFPEYVPLFADTAARRFGEGLLRDPTIALTVPVYIMSRVVILILPLTSLRALPEAAFVDIDWTTFLPHV